MVMETFIKLLRSDATTELMKDNYAFILLTQIAIRARRTDVFNVENLKLGEALIGDHRSIGLSRQNYRTALKKLKKWGFVTIKTTTNGTIATICNSDVYDINVLGANQQSNHRVTTRQPSTNHRVTTNKNVKNDNNEKNDKYKKSKFKNNSSTNKGRFKFSEEADYTTGL